MPASGEGDSCCKNESTSEPRVRAQMLPEQLHSEKGTKCRLDVESSSTSSRHLVPFPEQLHSEKGTKCRLDVEEDSGAGRGDVVNPPVPEQGGGRRTSKAAEGQGHPRHSAYVGKGHGLAVVRDPGLQKLWS